MKLCSCNLNIKLLNLHDCKDSLKLQTMAVPLVSSEPKRFSLRKIMLRNFHSKYLIVKFMHIKNEDLAGH